MKYSLFFMLSILVLGACTKSEKAQFDIVIENGNVIDLVTGNMEVQTLCITDGKIIKVITNEDAMDYESKQIVDAKNTFLLPGFWDNHVHFRGGDSLIKANKEFLKLFIVNGITTVRDAGGDLTSSVLEWQQHISDKRLVGPNIFTSGPKIDGPNGTWAGSLAVESNNDIVKALDSLQTLKTDFVKLYDSRISGEAYLQTLRMASRRQLITSGHMPFTVELNQTVDAGIDAIEHLYYVMKGCAANEKEVTQKLLDKEIGFWEAMPMLLKNYQDSTAQETFTLLKQQNVFVVPTLHIGKTLSYLDEVDHSKDPYLKYMSPGILATYEGRINRAMNSSEKAIADRKALDAFFGTLTKSLNDAGVSLLAGSDSGAYNSFTYPGISLHKELEALVASGISPLDALRASAYNGPVFLQKPNYGSLSEGNIADIVLLEANPLEDIKNTQNIRAVITKNTVHANTQLKLLLTSVLTEINNSSK